MPATCAASVDVTTGSVLTFAASCPVTVTCDTVFVSNDGTFMTNWLAPGTQRVVAR